jgi:pSer/pThr/pTyr-binding forkhead associated (FHA) protein
MPAGYRERRAANRLAVARERSRGGRTARADFIVEAPLVSRLHCRLTSAASDQVVVEDLGSSNGTLVNGKRVDRSVLKTGDVLTVGRVEFRVLPG